MRTIYPEDVVKDGHVKVELTSDGCTLKYRYDWDFIKLMHNLKLKWLDPHWVKNTYGIVSPEDSAAEIVNILLNNGYAVDCDDETVIQKAISADYEPIPTRMILAGKTRIFIEWQGKNDDIYNDARSIKSSKWSNYHVVVDPAMYQDIEGFAEKWGFVITDEASEMMQNAKEMKERSTVKVAAPKRYVPAEFDGESVLRSEAKVMQKHILE